MSGLQEAVGATRRQLRRVRRKVRRLRRGRGNAPAAPSPVTGIVESFERRVVLGWVAGSAASLPVRVTLNVNGVEVATTWTDTKTKRNARGEARQFRFSLDQLWDYCAKTDRITVRIDGKPLPINGHGMFRRAGTSGEHSLDDLRALLAQGYLFGQTGKLQLSKTLDAEWQAKVFTLYRLVGDVMRREHGYDLFVAYGTLLGLVRDGGFIGHDVDFDAAFISRCTDGPATAAELRDIAFSLIDAGLDAVLRKYHVHIHHADDPELRIDVFPMYFGHDDELAIPWGAAGQTKYSKSQWKGTVAAELVGNPVRIPADAETMVEYLYGDTWRTPVPGFSWGRDRTSRALEGTVPPSYIEEVYWANFYARTEFLTGSTFFDHVNARDDLPRTVLDVGCGDGRDSISFARAGRRVVGVDRSQVAVDHARRRAEQEGHGELVSFRTGDVSEDTTMREIIGHARQAAAGGPLLFYLRFFLHSIDEATQETLLAAIAAMKQDGDAFAAEFRTEKDEANEKTYGKHFRRYQDGPAFGRALVDRYGFTILDEHEGSGLAPYKDEDPELYRVIARAGQKAG